METDGAQPGRDKAKSPLVDKPSYKKTADPQADSKRPGSSIDQVSKARQGGSGERPLDVKSGVETVKTGPGVDHFSSYLAAPRQSDTPGNSGQSADTKTRAAGSVEPPNVSATAQPRQQEYRPNEMATPYGGTTYDVNVDRGLNPVIVFQPDSITSRAQAKEGGHAGEEKASESSHVKPEAPAGGEKTPVTEADQQRAALNQKLMVAGLKPIPEMDFKPTDFEQKIEGNSSYQVQYDPATGKVTGYRYESDGYWRTQDRQGNITDGGERRLEQPPIDPSDVLSLDGSAVEKIAEKLGRAALKAGLKDLGKVASRDASQVAERKIGKEAVSETVERTATKAEKQIVKETKASNPGKVEEIPEVVPPSLQPKPNRSVVERVYAEEGRHPLLDGPTKTYFDNPHEVHHYVVDQRDRPLFFEGWFRTEAAPRHGDQRRLAELMLGRDGGLNASHGAAARFGGDGRHFNLVPLPAEINQGAIKKLEDNLAKNMKNGQRFYTQVHYNYASNGLVPATVQYRVYVREGHHARLIHDELFYTSH